MAETQGSFDAGTDFASPATALADLVGSGSPAPADDQPAPAPDATEGDTSWADQEAEGTEAPKTQSPAAPALEVKGAKGVQKFDLDPNNAELKRTLELGLGFRPMQAQRDQARQEAKALKTEVAPLREKAAVWDELQSLAQAGHTDRVVRAVLGDQAYAAYRKSVSDEENGYASADPQRRAELDNARTTREANFSRTQYDKKVAALEAKAQATEDRIESDRLRGIGQQALGKYSFRDVVADADQAEALDQHLWTAAWTKLETLQEGGRDVNAQLVTQVFAQTAKVLRGGHVAAAATKTAEIVGSKKVQAKQQAQVAATSRYPSTAPAPSADKWNGKSMTDLLRSLRK
jgi:hypothetical protein